MPRIERLLKILTLLKSRRPGERLGRARLAEECSCGIRTIQRDLDLLMTQTSLCYDASVGSYDLPENGWTYPITTLTLPEVFSLSLARGLLTAPGLPQGAAAVAALDKITHVLSPQLRSLLAEAASVVRPLAAPRDYSRVPFSLLVEAAQARRTVEFEYENRSREECLRRRVDPYLIDHREGRWELHGWCHRRQAVRTFAADRIRDALVLADTFAVREEDWAAFVGERGVVGGLRGGSPIKVAVEFDIVVAAYARDKQWPDGLAISSRDDGSALLTGVALGTDGILPELLRWRRHARVLGGPELRRCIVEELKAMAELYKNRE